MGLTALAPLHRLRSLSLIECEVVDAALPIVATLASLEQVNLDFCRHITDTGIAALGALGDLRVLNARGCERVRGEGFAALSDCTALTALNLSWTPRLTLGGVEALCGLSGLQELWLPWCGLSNRQVQSLAALTGLRGLSVANTTDLTATGIEALVRGCRSLTR